MKPSIDTLSRCYCYAKTTRTSTYPTTITFNYFIHKQNNHIPTQPRGDLFTASYKRYGILAFPSPIPTGQMFFAAGLHTNSSQSFPFVSNGTTRNKDQLAHHKTKATSPARKVCVTKCCRKLCRGKIKHPERSEVTDADIFSVRTNEFDPQDSNTSSAS